MRLTKKLKQQILDTSKRYGYWSNEVGELLESIRYEISEDAWEKAHNIARRLNLKGIKEVYR